MKQHDGLGLGIDRKWGGHTYVLLTYHTRTALDIWNYVQHPLDPTQWPQHGRDKTETAESSDFNTG